MALDAKYTYFIKDLRVSTRKLYNIRDNIKYDYFDIVFNYSNAPTEPIVYDTLEEFIAALEETLDTAYRYLGIYAKLGRTPNFSAEFLADAETYLDKSETGLNGLIKYYKDMGMI